MERVFSTIPSVLASASSDESTAEALVFAAWKNVAGEAVNRRTHAVKLAGRKLTVAVDDAVWQRNLAELAPGFIARINRIAGEGTVRFIEFTVDQKAVRRVENKTTQPSDFALSSSLVTAAGAIADERLRQNFLAAAADYLARQNAR